MAKPLTFKSLDTEPKFELKLDEETHERLIKYLVLSGNATGRNKYINSLIADSLKDKVLDNDLIDIRETPFYFNKNELLQNNTVKATPNLTSHNLEEIFVVQYVPNNLDDFNKDLGTYCFGNNPNKHAGYYILPKYKDHKETHFSFLYDSEKNELEIGLENPNNIDIAFNPLDDKKQKIKDYLLKLRAIHETELARGEMHPYDFLSYYNVMYSYHLNLKLYEIRRKQETEGLSDADFKERDNIYFEGIYLE